MSKDKIRDITIEILVSIRDEIRGLREDTNARFAEMDARFAAMDARFAEMDKRFERIENDISQMRLDIKAIATHFDRDYLSLASETEDIKKRLLVCEERLGISER